MPAIFDTDSEQPPSAHTSHILQHATLAETMNVPRHRIVCVEHPCIINNIENGIKSMGGEPRMKHIMEHHIGDSLLTPQKPRPEPELGVSFRPDDPLAAKLTSVGVDTRNVLIKVTVPRRTGRKRKRGSQNPFEHQGGADPPSSLTAPELLKRLRDNESKYTIAPVGLVHETHRFRGLPDFQTRCGDQSIFQELNAHVLKPSWSNLKDFRLDLTPGIPMQMNSFPGPPSYASSAQPFRYEYQQAAGVRFSQDDEGNYKTTNRQAPPRKIMKAIPPDEVEVPQGPPPNMKPHNPSSTLLPRMIKALEGLLEERPVVTRRVAMNRLPEVTETVFKEAVDWVGYSFKAGPFRDCVIKYGVDPRKSPEFGKYQTLMFQLDRKYSRAGENDGKWTRLGKPDLSREQLATGHIFDGKHLSMDGKIWQLCDLTDPIIVGILEKTTIRTECDIYSFGWYTGAAICTVRMILRNKIEAFLKKEPIRDELYALLAKLPDDLEPFTYEYASVWLGDTPLAREAGTLASEIRSMVKAFSHKAALIEAAGREIDTAEPEDNGAASHDEDDQDAENDDGQNLEDDPEPTTPA